MRREKFEEGREEDCEGGRAREGRRQSSGACCYCQVLEQLENFAQPFVKLFLPANAKKRKDSKSRKQQSEGDGAMSGEGRYNLNVPNAKFS